MANVKDLMAQKNVLSDEAVRYIQGYLIYLRKSRQDDPNETVEEVLAKHERQLQELAIRELGGRIPEENIYREIVSGGESIDERIEIKKVLSRLEDNNVLGVLVIDPQRLSRGSLTDCDRLIMSFQYTDSLVITPMMTYDMKKKMERRFFQDELMRGRDYLDYVKETLWRGRLASAKRGCYIGAVPPYGYSKVKIGKDWTLEPNEDADTVRMMFDWCVNEGLGPGRIAHRLTSMGYKTLQGGKAWSNDSVRAMLSNPHYLGKIRYNYKKLIPTMESGRQVNRVVVQPDEEVVLVEGRHPAIIDEETFEKAQNMLKQNTKCRVDQGLVNPLAGILRCKNCGRVMSLNRSNHKWKRVDRFNCLSRPFCYKSVKCAELIGALITALEQVELPNLQAKLANGEGDAYVIQKRRIDKLVKTLSEYREQEEQQYDFLETGRYTPDVFDRRNKALREKIDACEKELHFARQAMPRDINYGERITALKEAISALRDESMSNESKNRILKSIIERIDYSATDLGFKQIDVRLDVFLRLQ